MIGTALDVWEIVAARRGFESHPHMARETGISEAQISVALAYAEQFGQEIADAIAENERPIDDLRREYPTIATIAAE